jgi:hypothetical protein
MEDDDSPQPLIIDYTVPQKVDKSDEGPDCEECEGSGGGLLDEDGGAGLFSNGRLL